MARASQPQGFHLCLLSKVLANIVATHLPPVESDVHVDERLKEPKQPHTKHKRAYAVDLLTFSRGNAPLNGGAGYRQRSLRRRAADRWRQSLAQARPSRLAPPLALRQQSASGARSFRVVRSATFGISPFSAHVA